MRALGRLPTHSLLASRILAEARRLPDEEVCGLVYGDSVLPIANVSPKPEGFFLMDARALIAAYTERGEPDGVYHSHPGGRKTPSSVDVAEALPGVRYFIAAGDNVYEYAP